MITIKNQEGVILPGVLGAILAFIILSGSVLMIIQTNLSSANRNAKLQEAFNIAEAGANYYLWHLSHSSTDYKDGTNAPATPDPELGYGPYAHDYYGDDGRKKGTYTLWIKPDSEGSTVVTVRSTGQVTGSNLSRTIEARIGAISFANYALASDQAIWFGDTETADGPIHSNQGVLMDGPNTGPVTSTNSTYVVPSGLAPSGHVGQTRPGVWCLPTTTTPMNCATRSKADWTYPAPNVDFNQVTSSLCNIKKIAFAANAATASLATQSNACTRVPTTRTSTYLPQRSTSGNYNLTQGYLIELNPNGTYNLYNVNGENDQAATYSAALTTTLIANNIAPDSSGVIFAEDNIWIRTNPQFSGRITIASGRLATSSSTNIVIADDVVYSNKSGTDAIGLIAEDSVIVAPYAIPQTGNFNFQIHAAIIAQTGRVGYPYTYRTSSSKCTRGWSGANQKLEFYGSIATRQGWTWLWLVGNGCGNSVSSPSGWISGPLNNVTQYDEKLQFAPPPNYPLTSGHNILSWREVLYSP